MMSPQDQTPQRHTIAQWPVGERPRERLLRHGAQALSDAELAAILLRTGARGHSAVEVGRALIQRAGGWRRLDQMSLAELRQIHGVGPAKAAQLKAAMEIGRRLAREEMPQAQAITQAADVAKLCMAEMRDLRYELFRVFYLNVKHKILCDQVISKGSLTASLVHPREILTIAIRESAAAMILVHNHPSGDPTPSQEDLALTQQIIEAARVVGVAVLDHVIIGADRYTSLRGEGQMR